MFKTKMIKIAAMMGALVLILSSCGASSIVGRWESIDEDQSFSEFEFFSDGTYASNRSNYSGNYSIDGDRLRLSGILVSDRTFTFEIDGDNLKLYEDGELAYEFVKAAD